MSSRMGREQKHEAWDASDDNHAYMCGTGKAEGRGTVWSTSNAGGAMPTAQSSHYTAWGLHYTT